MTKAKELQLRKKMKKLFHDSSNFSSGKVEKAIDEAIRDLKASEKKQK